jgi:hypothetical protein
MDGLRYLVQGAVELGEAFVETVAVEDDRTDLYWLGSTCLGDDKMA